MQRHRKKDLIWFDLVEIFVIPLGRLCKISRFISILWQKNAALCATKKIFSSRHPSPPCGGGDDVRGLSWRNPTNGPHPIPVAPLSFPTNCFFSHLFLLAQVSKCKEELILQKGFQTVSEVSSFIFTNFPHSQPKQNRPFSNPLKLTDGFHFSKCLLFAP